jgi:hypothetical protein
MAMEEVTTVCRQRKAQTRILGRRVRGERCDGQIDRPRSGVVGELKDELEGLLTRSRSDRKKADLRSKCLHFCSEGLIEEAQDEQPSPHRSDRGLVEELIDPPH